MQTFRTRVGLMLLFFTICCTTVTKINAQASQTVEIIRDDNTEIFIYPNPSNGRAVVKYPQAKPGDKLELYSPAGKKYPLKICNREV